MNFLLKLSVLNSDFILTLGYPNLGPRRKTTKVDSAKCEITVREHYVLSSYTGMTCQLSYYTVQLQA